MAAMCKRVPGVVLRWLKVCVMMGGLVALIALDMYMLLGDWTWTAVATGVMVGLMALFSDIASSGS